MVKKRRIAFPLNIFYHIIAFPHKTMPNHSIASVMLYSRKAPRPLNFHTIVQGSVDDALRKMETELESLNREKIIHRVDY